MTLAGIDTRSPLLVPPSTNPAAAVRHDQLDDAIAAAVAALQQAIAGRQPLDDDLTTIAGLSPTDGKLLRRVAGAWAASDLAAADVGAIPTSAMGQPGGPATLDTNGRVAGAQMYAASPTQWGVVQLAGDLGGSWDAPTVPGLPKRLVTAKGDLVAASAAGAVSRLGVGNDNETLLADSTQTLGVRWASTPLGVIARAARTTNATATSAATERAVLELQAALKTGRLYRITASGGVLGSAANGYSLVTLRATTNGTQPSTSSTQLAQHVVPMPTAAIGYGFAFHALYVPTANVTMRALLGYGGSASNNATMQGGATYPITLLIEDLGVDPGATGTNR